MYFRSWRSKILGPFFLSLLELARVMKNFVPPAFSLWWRPTLMVPWTATAMWSGARAANATRRGVNVSVSEELGADDATPVYLSSMPLVLQDAQVNYVQCDHLNVARYENDTSKHWLYQSLKLLKTTKISAHQIVTILQTNSILAPVTWTNID